MNNKRYYVINLFFATCLYFGTFKDVDRAMWVALGIAWVVVIVVILISIGKVWGRALAQARPNRLSRAIDFTFDMIIAIVFFKFGFVVTGVFYCIQQAIITYEVSKWQRG